MSDGRIVPYKKKWMFKFLALLTLLNVKKNKPKI